jgi:hypothetical protein
MNAKITVEYRKKKDTNLFFWVMTQSNENGILFKGKSRLFSSKVSAKRHFLKTVVMLKSDEFEVVK